MEAGVTTVVICLLLLTLTTGIWAADSGENMSELFEDDEDDDEDEDEEDDEQMVLVVAEVTVDVIVVVVVAVSDVIGLFD